jgi:hypothetical protein
LDLTDIEQVELQCVQALEDVSHMHLYIYIYIHHTYAHTYTHTGVCLDLTDIEQIELQCVQALEMGFDGKTLIHPTQIEPANRIFAPTQPQLELSKVVCLCVCVSVCVRMHVCMYEDSDSSHTN